MIITLNDTDIKRALENYVKSVIGRPINKCEINITAGRGANGYSADVELFFSDEAATECVISDESQASLGAPTPLSKKESVFVPATEEDCEPVAYDKPRLTLDSEESKPTLASKVSNPEAGKKTNLNLFASED